MPVYYGIRNDIHMRRRSISIIVIIVMRPDHIT